MNPGLTLKCSPLSILIYCCFPLDSTAAFIRGSLRAEKGPGLCLLAQGDKAGSPGKQPSPAFSPPTPHHRNTSGCVASQNLSSRETGHHLPGTSQARLSLRTSLTHKERQSCDTPVGDKKTAYDSTWHHLHVQKTNVLVNRKPFRKSRFGYKGTDSLSPLILSLLHAWSLPVTLGYCI